MNPFQISEPSNVTLEEMLRAKDIRVKRQRGILRESGGTLICFTLNLAGPHKQFPLARKTFGVEQGKILAALNNGCRILRKECFLEKTGCEGYLSVDRDAESIKRLMVAIEDGLPLARLFDIDVLRTDGSKISRSDLGDPPRTCLICGRPAPECARSRSHSVEELEQKTLGLMYDYFGDAFCEKISATALRALLYEVCITPKPGLVDRWNNGAHRDMDVFTFVDSCVALAPFFREFAMKGLTAAHSDPSLLLPELKTTGKGAEEAMRIATGGVNTHKGAIFSIGLLCASLGFLFGRDIPYCPEAACGLCRQITEREAKRDLSRITAQTAATHGEKVYARLGIPGVRGEAANGYESVLRFGLPMLKWLLAQGKSLNDACVVTLLNLIANVRDTNVFSRTDCRPPDLRRKIERTILKMGESSESIARSVQALDDDFVREGISPGGCADLLAFTLMLYFLEEEDSAALKQQMLAPAFYDADEILHVI